MHQQPLLRRCFRCIALGAATPFAALGAAGGTPASGAPALTSVQPYQDPGSFLSAA